MTIEEKELLYELEELEGKYEIEENKESKKIVETDKIVEIIENNETNNIETSKFKEEIEETFNIEIKRNKEIEDKEEVKEKTLFEIDEIAKENIEGKELGFKYEELEEFRFEINKIEEKVEYEENKISKKIEVKENDKELKFEFMDLEDNFIHKKDVIEKEIEKTENSVTLKIESIENKEKTEDFFDMEMPKNEDKEKVKERNLFEEIVTQEINEEIDLRYLFDFFYNECEENKESKKMEKYQKEDQKLIFEKEEIARNEENKEIEEIKKIEETDQVKQKWGKEEYIEISENILSYEIDQTDQIEENMEIEEFNQVDKNNEIEEIETDQVGEKFQIDRTKEIEENKFRFENNEKQEINKIKESEGNVKEENEEIERKVNFFHEKDEIDENLKSEHNKVSKKIEAKVNNEENDLRFLFEELEEKNKNNIKKEEIVINNAEYKFYKKDKELEESVEFEKKDELEENKESKKMDEMDKVENNKIQRIDEIEENKVNDMEDIEIKYALDSLFTSLWHHLSFLDKNTDNTFNDTAAFEYNEKGVTEEKKQENAAEEQKYSVYSEEEVLFERESPCLNIPFESEGDEVDANSFCMNEEELFSGANNLVPIFINEDNNHVHDDSCESSCKCVPLYIEACDVAKIDKSYNYEDFCIDSEDFFVAVFLDVRDIAQIGVKPVTVYINDKYMRQAHHRAIKNINNDKSLLKIKAPNTVNPHIHSESLIIDEDNIVPAESVYDNMHQNGLTIMPFQFTFTTILL